LIVDFAAVDFDFVGFVAAVESLSVDGGLDRFRGHLVLVAFGLLTKI